MCGIAGYVGSRQVGEDRIQACLARMGRRGPDHAGHGRWNLPGGREAVLLHSRLAIIDLDARANQPFHRGGHDIVLNGEIYNYLELRRTLEGQGQSFATSSDTEVLLAALARDGIGGLESCEGMWAFAWLDRMAGTVTLSRDRFGEKPLYLLRAHGGLYFGSEIKFLAALSGLRLSPDLNQLRRFMVNGYRTLHRTGGSFWQDVVELPAGGFLRIGADGTEQAGRYWTPRIGPEADLDFGQSVEAVRSALVDAVRIRLRADVPLAFCQSGGIDSNGLISIARNVLGHDVHGFTIVNTHERYAEQDMVDLAVERQGLRHTAIHLDNRDFLGRLGRLVEYHDAPVYTLSAYVHWLLMEAVRGAGYKIVVAGVGADELFSGYYDHHLLYLADMAGDPARHAAALANWRAHIEPLTQNPLLRNPDLFIDNPDERGHLTMNADVYGGWMRPEWSEPFAERRWPGTGHLRNRMLNELFCETVPQPLHDEDLNAMYWSLENRSPYLDRRLFELVYSLPVRHLVRDGRAKAVLREALRGIVPDPVLDNRRKMGFNAPLNDLLDLGNPEIREALLAPSPIYDVVKREAMERLLGETDPDHSRNLFFFYLLSSKLFLEYAER